MKVVKECYYNQFRCFVFIVSYIYMYFDSCVNDDDNCDYDYNSNDDDRSFDKVLKKMKNFAEMFGNIMLK